MNVADFVGGFAVGIVVVGGLVFWWLKAMQDTITALSDLILDISKRLP